MVILNLFEHLILIYSIISVNKLPFRKPEKTKSKCHFRQTIYKCKRNLEAINIRSNGDSCTKTKRIITVYKDKFGYILKQCQRTY